MNTGALQPSPARQLIMPFPYSPPKMNAGFFRSGITATQRPRPQDGWATVPPMSWMALAADSRRAISDVEIAARALPAVHATSASARTNVRFMVHLRDRIAFAKDALQDLIHRTCGRAERMYLRLRKR